MDLWPLFIGMACVMLTAYGIMIQYAVIGWNRLKPAVPKEPNLSVSILVAARNEERHIADLLADLKRQDYPADLFEVIVIDDHSDDATLQRCKEIRFGWPQLTVIPAKDEYGKKAALQAGLAEAQYPIIATVDADCRVPSEWLKTMMAAWNPGSTRILLGPVVLQPARSYLEKVQQMEMMAIMGLTGGFAARGRPIMANGANLFIDRSALATIGGYNISENPSGDDVFTMLHIQERWPGSVQFVKDFRACVSTIPQSSPSLFWQQRKRWLSKKGGYANRWVKTTAWVTYGANFSVFLGMVFLPFSMGKPWFDHLIGIFVLKTLLDLYLIRSVRKDLQPDCGILHIIPTELFIVCYITLIGAFGRSHRYVWKGRTVRLND